MPKELPAATLAERGPRFPTGLFREGVRERWGLPGRCPVGGMSPTWRIPLYHRGTPPGHRNPIESRHLPLALKVLHLPWEEGRGEMFLEE